MPLRHRELIIHGHLSRGRRLLRISPAGGRNPPVKPAAPGPPQQKKEIRTGEGSSGWQGAPARHGRHRQVRHRGVGTPCLAQAGLGPDAARLPRLLAPHRPHGEPEACRVRRAQVRAGREAQAFGAGEIDRAGGMPQLLPHRARLGRVRRPPVPHQLRRARYDGARDEGLLRIGFPAGRAQAVVLQGALPGLVSTRRCDRRPHEEGDGRPLPPPPGSGEQDQGRLRGPGPFHARHPGRFREGGLPPVCRQRQAVQEPGQAHRGLCLGCPVARSAGSGDGGPERQGLPLLPGGAGPLRRGRQDAGADRSIR